MTGDTNTKFTELYNGTHHAVARYCVRRLPQDDARDALTETYLAAWRRFADVPEGNEALLWLYGIARNVIRNKARAARRSLRLVARLGREPADFDLDPVHQVIRSESDRAFLDTVDGLRPSDREVLRLRAFEDLDYHEIALVLGCTNGAARQRLSRALKRLEARLGAFSNTPRVEQEGGNRRVG